MKRFNRLIILVALLLSIFSANKIETHAYDVNVPISDSMSTSWTTPAAGFYFWQLSSGESGSGAVGDPISENYVTSFSTPISFTPTTAGTYTLTVSFDVSDQAGNVVAVPAVQKTYTVVAPDVTQPVEEPPVVTPPVEEPPVVQEPQPKSGNYYLATLSVDPGELSPAFTRLGDIYSITLPEGAETYSVYGTVEDPSATIIQGIGTFDVGPETFIHRVIVQAENGAMWYYDLTFVVNDTRSDNNNLRSLIVEGGKLTPTFNSDTLEYVVEVNPGTEKVKLSAVADDEKATVSGDGEIDLVEGEEKVVDVVVTAENETTKTYKLTIRETERPAQSIEFNGKSLEFDYDMPTDLEKIGFTLVDNLPGFEEGTQYYQNKSKTLNAVYLKEGETSHWYLIKDKTVTSQLRLVTLDNRVYGVMMTLDEAIKNQPDLNLIKIKLGDVDADGFKSKDAQLSQYQYAYLIDATGEPSFFLKRADAETVFKVDKDRLTAQVEGETESETEIVTATPVQNDSGFQSILFLIITLLSIAALVVAALLIRNRQNRSTRL